ncbi:MAG: hypothetical protein L6R36_005663 [Xanthoria steineri]|nr:MAG: hypothetical protein L6R36_005663 [Xanthoria steineri]
MFFAAAAPAKNHLLAVRQAAPTITDGVILNYAVTHEHLEDIFYREILDEFSDFILTVESRHSAYIRNALAESPFPSPFDVPLAYNEVHTLAANVKSCPKTNPPRPFKAFPTLTASPNNPKTISVGTQITLFTDGYTVKAANGKSQIYGVFFTITGPFFTEATPINGVFTFTVLEAAEAGAPSLTKSTSS